MAERYIHDIDPVLVSVAGVHLWWYGLGFALGFLHLHRFLMRDRVRLGLSRRDIWSLSVAAHGRNRGGRPLGRDRL